MAHLLAYGIFSQANSSGGSALKFDGSAISLIDLINKSILLRAYPEKTNFETFVPRNLKLHTFNPITLSHTTKNAENLNLIL